MVKQTVFNAEHSRSSTHLALRTELGLSLTTCSKFPCGTLMKRVFSAEAQGFPTQFLASVASNRLFFTKVALRDSSSTLSTTSARERSQSSEESCQRALRLIPKLLKTQMHIRSPSTFDI